MKDVRVNQLEQLGELLRSGALASAALHDRSGVLVDLRGRQVLALNATAMALVEDIRAGVQTQTELVESLHRKFSGEKSDIANEVASFLEALSRAFAKAPEDGTDET